MFDALLLLFIAKNDLANPRYVSLKHLTTIMGYHPAKKLEKEKTPFKLNLEALALAKGVDALPNDLKQIIHGYLDTDQTIAKLYGRSYKERNYWIFNDEEKAKTEISKLPCGNPSTFTKTRIQGPLNLFFDSTRGDIMSICYQSLVATNHTTEMWGEINSDYPYYSYWTDTHLKFDNTTNIIFAYSTIEKRRNLSYFFSTKYQIKAWKPQCNLQQLQQDFTTVDWVILNMPKY